MGLCFNLASFFQIILCVYTRTLLKVRGKSGFTTYCLTMSPSADHMISVPSLVVAMMCWVLLSLLLVKAGAVGLTI